MSLSVVAGRSHSGFRAAVYGIHFDPWVFDTLLYLVKMVAVFCLCEGTFRGGLSYIDFLSTSEIHPPPSARPFSKGATRFGLSLFRFHTASGIHPPPSARPFSKGLLASDYLSFAFTPLRGSILRLRRGPSPRAYSLRTISLSLSHRFVDPSSAFGAPLL